MNDAFIGDALRTPFARYGGALSSVRADDLGAIPIKALMTRHPGLDWVAVTDVIYGCANQAGEDNRNLARMSALLAYLPIEVPGSTVNRLCGSGLDALGTAAQMWQSLGKPAALDPTTLRPKRTARMNTRSVILRLPKRLNRITQPLKRA